MKAEWVFSIIASLEARFEYCDDQGMIEERKRVAQALDYFRDLEVYVAPAKDGWQIPPFKHDSPESGKK